MERWRRIRTSGVRRGSDEMKGACFFCELKKKKVYRGGLGRMRFGKAPCVR